MSAVDDIEIVTFTAGDYIFHENEKSFHFFIVQEGQVEVFKTSPNGAKLPLAIVGPGVSLGEFAMLDQQPRSATARALTEVKAAKISEAGYQQLLQELPEWAVSVMGALVDRIRHTNELIRKKGIVDDSILAQIDAMQLDSSTISDTNPDLRSANDADEEVDFMTGRAPKRP
ncbi:MAG: cyclic nucleotide-binding domain-containing protein [Bdellovibrionaceae bacterium]|nr:cyclic nucleotide-binding domain-containing protein [Pseudobdellovibrionaceae bacterium]